MNNTRRAWPALAVLGLLLVAGQPSELEKARAEYLARQERLRCAAHPDQGCLTQPESENEQGAARIPGAAVAAALRRAPDGR